MWQSGFDRVTSRALAFLLGYSALAALLNYLSALQPASVQPAVAGQSAPRWVLAAGWMLLVLFYLPIYGAFVHSVRHWQWSLDEWGFGLKGRAWLAMGPALLALLLIWLPLPAVQLGSVWIGNVDSLRMLFSQASIPMLLFGGYARVAEELLYRGFALVLFQRIFSQSRFSGLWAVLLSSALFALVHTHRIPEMAQLFLGAAVPLTAFTLWTRSISFALVIHAMAGGGQMGALVAAVFFTAVAVCNTRMASQSRWRTS